MKDVPAPLSREERLAAKLRENLRRRKAQSREMDARGPTDADTEPGADPAGEAGENAALPKGAPKS